MQHARKVSLCTDIWSKPGFTASFLGITCHYFNGNKKKYHITLAVQHFPSPHTADLVLQIFQSVTEEWQLPPAKILRVLTDNGSNMISAFKIGDNDEEIEGDGTTNSDRMEQCEEEEVENDDDEEDVMPSVETEIEESDRLEEEHRSTFSCYKRNSCVRHTLQLVVKIFETNPAFRSTLQKAKKIFKKVNKSTKATESLIQKAHKKLMGNCKTRDTTNLMLSSMIEVKAHLSSVLDELL